MGETVVMEVTVPRGCTANHFFQVRAPPPSNAMVWVKVPKGFAPGDAMDVSFAPLKHSDHTVDATVVTTTPPFRHPLPSDVDDDPATTAAAAGTWQGGGGRTRGRKT